MLESLYSRTSWFLVIRQTCTYAKRAVIRQQRHLWKRRQQSALPWCVLPLARLGVWGTSAPGREAARVRTPRPSCQTHPCAWGTGRTYLPAHTHTSSLPRETSRDAVAVSHIEMGSLVKMWWDKIRPKGTKGSDRKPKVTLWKNQD